MIIKMYLVFQLIQKKGYNFYQSLLLENRIYSEIRPIEEEYDFESRLHTPTPIPKERNKFKKNV